MVRLTQLCSREKNKTPNDATKAAHNPLPPSKKPNAVPWFRLPPIKRVLFINGDQKRQIVLKPQKL